MTCSGVPSRRRGGRGVGVAWGVAKRSGMLARAVGAAIVLASSAPRADPALMERSPTSLAIFGSLEADAGKTYGSVGLKWSPGGGLDASGFRLGLKWGESVEPASLRHCSARCCARLRSAGSRSGGTRTRS